MGVHNVIARGLVLLLLLSACTHVMKTYPGQVLPSNQTAIVESGAYTEIVSFDGQVVTSQALSILPGRHTIQMRIFEGQQRMSVQWAFYSLADGSVDFIAEPGHRYLVSVDVVASPFPLSGPDDSGFRWMGYVTDRTSKQTIASTNYLPVGAWPIISRSLTGAL